MHERAPRIDRLRTVPSAVRLSRRVCFFRASLSDEPIPRARPRVSENAPQLADRGALARVSTDERSAKTAERAALTAQCSQCVAWLQRIRMGSERRPTFIARTLAV